MLLIVKRAQRFCAKHRAGVEDVTTTSFMYWLFTNGHLIKHEMRGKGVLYIGRLHTAAVAAATRGSQC